jgi:hypothetical protein
MIRLAIVFLIAGTATASAQGISVEQAAFDYFFGEVFRKEFTDVATVQFSGCTEQQLTNFGIRKICFPGEDALRSQIENAASGVKRSKKDIGVDKIEGIKFKKGSARFRLHVLQGNEINGKNYVLIEVIEKDRNTTGYYIELDADQQVLRWCKTQMVH